MCLGERGSSVEGRRGRASPGGRRDAAGREGVVTTGARHEASSPELVGLVDVLYRAPHAEAVMKTAAAEPTGQDFATFLREHRGELIRAWERRVLGDPSVPEASRLSRPELHDHIPTFIDELVGVLEAASASESTGRTLGGSVAAREHARQRRESGYSLIAALRELSHFRAALIELSTEAATCLDGDVAHLVHAAIDQSMMTGADEMEQAMLAAHRQDTALRERFIGILGHDLRTPLTTIMVAMGTLRKDLELPAEKARLLDRVTASTERMTRLIGDLLDATRLRLDGRLPLTTQPIELVALAQGVVEEQQSARPDRVVSLSAAGPVRGTWDPDRLVQVIANLISNALDYSLPDTPVRVAVHLRGTEALLTVHNRGPSIPAEARAHLFDPFYQGPQSGRTSKRSSFGLGLFIAEQIVTAHHGTIEVTSTDEHGTTFHVRLPDAR